MADIISKITANGINAIFIKKKVESDAIKNGKNRIINFSNESNLKEISNKKSNALFVALLIFLNIISTSFLQ